MRRSGESPIRKSTLHTSWGVAQSSRQARQKACGGKAVGKGAPRVFQSGASCECLVVRLGVILYEFHASRRVGLSRVVMAACREMPRKNAAARKLLAMRLGKQPPPILASSEVVQRLRQTSAAT